MKKKILTKNNNKGVALVWALLFSMIILVISSSMAILIVKELRITANVDESNRAYLAAESGMEEGLYRLKGYLNSNINWFCPSGTVSFSKNLDGSVLAYSGTISCVTVGGTQAIDIESTGTELSRTQRKLRTRITFVDPTNRIERYNVNPGISSVGGLNSYPFPSGSVTSGAPLLIQQFDIDGLNNTNAAIRIGMMDDSGRRVNIRITRTNNSRDTFTLEQNLLGGSSPSVTITNTNSNSYRVKIEYAQYGGSYTVLRASIFKKNISGGFESFVCADTTAASINPIIFQGIGAGGFVPTRVIVDPGTWQNPAANSNNGFIRLDGFSSGVRLDNMVFWSKE